ncbi:MAG TPA: hypothetical protein GYA10_14325 [Alphaproteobacteria bacterium]|nr:hypothetical protein [Alphaproteobacteria bacterium]
MDRIEPPLEPPERRPDKEIELEPGKVRRVVTYSPWFIWGMVVFWSGFILVQLHVTGGDWLSALRFGAPGLFIGVVLGIRFRDAQ